MKAKADFVHKLRVLGVSVLLLAVPVGCSTKGSDEQKAAPPPPPVQSEYVEHQVRYSGESLGVISQWYTGKLRNWRILKDANPNIRAEKIAIGQWIRIPRAVVVREEPMPPTFVKKFNSQYKKAAAPKPEDAAAAGQEQPTAPTPPSGEGYTGPIAPPVAEAKTVAPVPVPPAPPAPPVAPPPPPAEKAEEAVRPPSPQPTPPAPVAQKPAQEGSDDAERERLLDELLQ